MLIINIFELVEKFIVRHQAILLIFFKVKNFKVLSSCHRCLNRILHCLYDE
jgi:hypothetical protein